MMQATCDGDVHDNTHRLLSILPMFLLPQINHHLDFSFNPQSPINLKPYPKLKALKLAFTLKPNPKPKG
jgi:hypothetical protein